jgi:SAM-dependent methyltransferase
MAFRGVTVDDLREAFAGDRNALAVIAQLSAPSTPHPAVDPTLAAEFAARGPWITRFWIDGAPYGGEYDLTRDPRLGLAEAAMGGFAGKRVLELGALEGGHSVALAQRGATVVALEGRAASCERARWVTARLGLDSIRFEVADVRAADITAYGRFDLVLNSGLLYHLDAPWELLARLAGVAPLMFIWTHYALDDRATERVVVGGTELRGARQREFGPQDPLSGLQPTSFWPTRDSLTTMLRLTGWSEVASDVQPAHPDGPGITLVVRAAGGTA